MKIFDKKKLKDKEIKIMCRQMSSMFRSGCNIVKIFETIIGSSSINMARALNISKKNIESGKSLAESFANSNQFSKFFVNMIHAGEVSGNIDYILERLSLYYEREDKLRSKIISVSIYPVILIIVSIIALNFVMLFVIPNFEMAFSIESMELPNSTRRVFAISNYLRKNIIYIFISVVAIIGYIIKSIKGDYRYKLWIDEALFKIPIVKKINVLIISDKFSRVLSILLDSGVHIVDAIDISSKILNNSYAEDRLKIAKNNIEKGNNVTDSLELSGIFPRIFISMIESGEEAGRFNEALDTVGKYYEEELDIELENFIKMFEPVMIVLMGVLIGATMIVLLSPMFDIISSIS